MKSSTNISANFTEFNSTLVDFIDLLFKNYTEGVVYKDKSFRYISANKTFCDCYNIKNLEEFIGQTNIPFLTKENKKLVYDVNSTILRDFCPVSYIMHVKNKILNITSSPIIKNKEFYGIISIVKDITQEEIIKEKFVHKHFQLKSLLENIPMLIYMQDKNLNYITGTKHSQDYVKDGYDSINNIKINLSKAKNDDNKDNEFVFSNNETVVKEKEIIDNEGRAHWYKIYKVPINDFNNNVTGIITLANNIDAEKQLQTQRETFVASLGHDLKNPTIAQIRSLELLLKGHFGEINSEQQELIEMLLDSCRYMNGMLSSLLATYRNYGGNVKLNFGDFSLIELVKECVSEMVYVAKDKEVIININNKFENKTVFADRVQIKRVIMNLLSNGIKYAYKDTHLDLNIYSRNNQAYFEFKNKSAYIPEDMQKALFAQYVSYAFAHKELGIGLGLYTSKKIIEGHNGNIFVKSFKDNQNIFGFSIPITQSLSEINKEICF